MSAKTRPRCDAKGYIRLHKLTPESIRAGEKAVGECYYSTNCIVTVQWEKRGSNELKPPTADGCNAITTVTNIKRAFSYRGLFSPSLCFCCAFWYKSYIMHLDKLIATAAATATIGCTPGLHLPCTRTWGRESGCCRWPYTGTWPARDTLNSWQAETSVQSLTPELLRPPPLSQSRDTIKWEEPRRMRGEGEEEGRRCRLIDGLPGWNVIVNGARVQKACFYATSYQACL